MKILLFIFLLFTFSSVSAEDQLSNKINLSSQINREIGGETPVSSSRSRIPLSTTLPPTDSVDKSISTSLDESIIDPIPLAHNPRIRIYPYKEDYIYRYTGNYEYQSNIRFEPGEVIETISMGDPTGWELVPSANRLFLRPKNDKANTLMTLISNKRIYQFIMQSGKSKAVDDPNVILEVRFEYPNLGSDSLEIYTGENLVPDISKPGNYNFQYSYSGSENIAPVHVFDDGDFTYFEFPSHNAELPAIFYVDSDGFEGLVNFKTSGDYLIVERVNDLFTLRNGVDTVCVFNEKIYHRIPRKD